MPSNNQHEAPDPETLRLALEIAEAVLSAALQIVAEERAARLPQGPGSFIPQEDLK